MLGFNAFAAAPFASLAERVHLLAVQEGATSTDTPRLTLQVALRVLLNSAGVTQGSGPSGNSRSALARADSVADAWVLEGVGLSIEETAAASEAPAALFGVVPLRVVETTLAQDPPPFARQRWEFIKTSTGAQWVPVQTGE
jgi:hypothetical protein